MEDTFSENSNFSESKSRIESSEPEELKLFITDEIFDKNCTKVPTGYKCNVCSKIVSCIQAAKAHLKTHKFILFGAKSIETVADILKALNRSQDIPSDKWNLIYTDNLLCLLCIKKGDYTKIKDEEKYDHALKVHAGQHICRVCHERFQYRKVLRDKHGIYFRNDT